MALILSLETSTTVCSVALAQDGRLIGQSELRLEKSHSSHITVLIQQLLANTGFTQQDLSAIAVSGGPGSYTGLRIGTGGGHHMILTYGRYMGDMSPKTTVSFGVDVSSTSASNVVLVYGTIHVEAGKRATGKTFSIDSAYLVATVKGAARNGSSER